MRNDLFELELLGGATERRFRALRPELGAMPWGTMDLSRAREEDLIAARRAWTGAAYQEHRTAVACAATLRALLEARAPVDLVGISSRFPLDEMVHVELCARMAMECGGGTEIRYDPDYVVLDASPSLSPLVRACELAVRFFCVGEAISIPLLRATWKKARHPLPRAVLGRIVKDEAAHGAFGFTVLDWALPDLTPEDLAHLGRMADVGIDFLHRQWDDLARRPRSAPHDGDVLNWMATDEYLEAAHRALEYNVRAPLKARGVPLRDRALEAPAR
ncbi:MAG: hypothetical protein HY909_28095 [Deltaproteobacteria bacterium]|nr:hypothetical protein [Deltaproteobacteria bacterium]